MTQMTDPEYQVMRSVVLSHHSLGTGSPWQPETSQLPVVRTLLDRGWLEPDPQFPAIAVPTYAGEDAFHAEDDRRGCVWGRRA